MAINVLCPECKRSFKVETKACTCGNDLTKNFRFKVRVKLPNGKWKTQQADTLKLAKDDAPNIDSVWKKYLKWAKANKRSWDKDSQRWTKHISPHVKYKRMDRITPSDVEKILEIIKGLPEQKQKKGDNT